MIKNNVVIKVGAMSYSMLYVVSSNLVLSNQADNENSGFS